MLNIVLIHPLIPQNTGNIGRLCVNINAKLHLISPLGFEIDQSKIKKAGMDYWQYLNYQVHSSWDNFLEKEKPNKYFFSSTKGEKSYLDYKFEKDSYIFFGNESYGLPKEFYSKYKEDLYTIPMYGDKARSLNLANSVAIISYEALRQINL